VVERLFARSEWSQWGITRERFDDVLQRSARKLFVQGAPAGSPRKLEEYLVSLNLADLALAAACADGNDAAWEHFVSVYRPYLRSAAAAILRSNAGSAEAVELADSLFAELYGMGAGNGPQRSLFRYFHGRSSLKTWLRAVLSQRHIDSLRANRKFEELSPEDGAESPHLGACASISTPLDPHRERYMTLFARALQASLEQLDPVEQQRLRLYYAEEQTLAEIGRSLGEHESSVSRHLDSTRKLLRRNVEEKLRRGIGAVDGTPAQPGLSEAEIEVCFEYVAEDVPFDLEKLLSGRQTSKGSERWKGPGDAPARK
jgi:RNA polymerase sigma-70 factor (ECF subfamily)